MSSQYCSKTVKSWIGETENEILSGDEIIDEVFNNH